MQPLRLALIGNLCDNAIIFANLLRADDLKPSIYMSSVELRACTLPAMQPVEGASFNEHIEKIQEANSDIHIWDYAPKLNWLMYLPVLGKIIFRGLTLIRFLWQLQKVDIILSFAMYHIVSLLSARPYITLSTGADLHEIAVEKSIKGWLMKHAFKRARSVRASFDPISKANAIRLKLGHIDPFLIPWPVPDKPPASSHSEGPIRVFMPSRQDWCDPERALLSKRNDFFIRAWARRVREGWDSVLTIVEHGEDVEATRSLVNDLGIADLVQFVPILDQASLQKQIENADLVADQFDQGTPGALALQALASGRALSIYWNESSSAHVFSQVAPVINGNSEKQLFEQLQRFAQRAHLRELGLQGHAWIKREYNHERLRRQLRWSIALACGTTLRE